MYDDRTAEQRARDGKHAVYEPPKPYPEPEPRIVLRHYPGRPFYSISDDWYLGIEEARRIYDDLHDALQDAGVTI